MKPFLHERVFSALLLELSSAHYSEGGRFLSLREVVGRFGVSKPTASLAHDKLLQSGLLISKPRSGLYVAPGAKEKAMLLLEKMPISNIPAPQSWTTKRNRITRMLDGQRLRVGIIYHTTTSLPSAGAIGSLGDLDDLAVGQLRGVLGCLAAGRERSAPMGFALHDGTSERNEDIRAWLERERFEGLLVVQRMQAFPQFHSLAEASLRRGIPIVTLFGSPPGPDIIGVDFNNVAAGFQAATRIAAIGRKRLKLIMPQSSGISTILRMEGARLATEQLGMEFHVVEVRLDTDRPELVPLFEGPSPADGVISTGYDFAVMAMEQARKLKLRPGKNFSLIAFSSTPELPGGKKMDIMRMDFDAVASTAVHTLLNGVEGKPVHRAILVPMEYESWGSV